MSTLPYLKSLLSSYEPFGIQTKELKSTLSLYVNMEPQLTNRQVISALKEDLPVTTLFHRNIVTSPSTLYKILREYLLLQGWEYTPHPDTDKIAYGIANSFFDSPIDKEYAFNALAGKFQPDRPSSNNASTSTENNNNYKVDEVKQAHNISQKFKQGKFKGKIGENINETFINYETSSKDYKLSESMMYQFLHNLFDESPLRFLREEVMPNCSTYNAAKLKMIDEYSNITTQNRVRKYLQSLTLSSIISKENIGISEGLDKLRNVIEKFSQQGPLSYRTDEAKIEYLFDALNDQEWASSTISNCYAQKEPWKFHQLCSALDAAWLQEQRKKGKHEEINKNTNDIIPINWQAGQGQYGIPRNKKFDVKTSKYRNHYFGPKIRCWNCKQYGHTHHNCPVKTKNVTKNIHNAITKNPNSAPTILYELCQYFDNQDSFNDNFENNNEDDNDNEDIVDQIHQNNDADSDFDSEDF